MVKVKCPNCGNKIEISEAEKWRDLGDEICPVCYTNGEGISMQPKAMEAETLVARPSL